jgi:hypothetical protein
VITGTVLAILIGSGTGYFAGRAGLPRWIAFWTGFFLASLGGAVTTAAGLP